MSEMSEKYLEILIKVSGKNLESAKGFKHAGITLEFFEIQIK